MGRKRSSPLAISNWGRSPIPPPLPRKKPPRVQHPKVLTAGRKRNNRDRNLIRIKIKARTGKRTKKGRPTPALNKRANASAADVHPADAAEKKRTVLALRKSLPQQRTPDRILQTNRESPVLRNPPNPIPDPGGQNSRKAANPASWEGPTNPAAVKKNAARVAAPGKKTSNRRL